MNELQFLIYTADNDSETASVIIKGETIWTSQKEMLDFLTSVFLQLVNT